MITSPYLVLYAEALLVIQFIYGLDLNDDELPMQNASGELDYEELGFKKWKYPCIHLAIQVKLKLFSFIQEGGQKILRVLYTLPVPSPFPPLRKNPSIVWLRVDFEQHAFNQIIKLTKGRISDWDKV